MSSDRLYELIHNLNQAEKRYFKQYLKRHSSKSDTTIYAKLFDFITKKEKYDKNELLKKCPFVKESQLQNIKSRLYDYVLESLRAYYAKSTIKILLFQLMINAEILENKGLFTESSKMLFKAEKIAEKYELNLFLKEILINQEAVITQRSKSKKQRQEITRIQDKIKFLNVAMQRQKELQAIKTKVYNLFRLDGRVGRTKTESEKIEAIIIQFNEKFILNKQSYVESNHYYIEYSDILRMQGKFKESYEMLLNLEAFFNNHPDYINIYHEDYLRLIARLVIISNMLKQFDISHQYIDIIRQSGSQSKQTNISIFVFENIVFHEIEIYLYQMRFDLALDLVTENLEKVNEVGDKINSVNQQSKFYRIALTYFGNGLYREALKWLNKILNTDNFKYRRDILSSVEVLNLMTHYYLGNYRLIKSRIPTTKLHLKQIDRFRAPEKLLISSLLKAMDYNNNEIEIFKKLIRDLELNSKINPLDQYFMAYLDFTAWLKAKTAGSKKILTA